MRFVECEAPVTLVDPQPPGFKEIPAAKWVVIEVANPDGGYYVGYQSFTEKGGPVCRIGTELVTGSKFALLVSGVSAVFATRLTEIIHPIKTRLLERRRLQDHRFADDITVIHEDPEP